MSRFIKQAAFLEVVSSVTEDLTKEEIAREAARQVTDDAAVVNLRAANMGGEDFAHYLQRVSGCYVRFGSQVEGREGFPAHSSRFDPDERALATGAAWFAAVARTAGQLLVRGELPRREQTP